MTEGPMEIKVGKFLSLLMGGIALGFIASLIISFSQERRYESRAIVASDDPRGSWVPLARIHAEMIARNLKPPLVAGSAETIRQNTRLRALGGGQVEIVATAGNPLDARNIALEAAKLFRGIPHQKKLASYSGHLPDPTYKDSAQLEDAAVLEHLLDEEAQTLEFPDFLTALAAAEAGDAKAKAFTRGEDFQRRFSRFNEIAMQYALTAAPGEPVTPPPRLLVRPRLAAYPSSSAYQSAIFMACLLAGAGGGLIAAFRFGEGPVELASMHLATATAAPPAARTGGAEDW